MAEWKGKIVTCDRCGAECRCKYLSEGVRDGGFTHLQKFEPMKDDWQYHPEVGWLCPLCESTFQRTIKNFMTYSKVHGK